MGISLGLVGLGSFGSQFANLFMSHPLVDRVGLCDREPDRMQAIADSESWQRMGKFNPKDIYSSLDDICKADFDALIIITQPWLHAPQCVQAMESGKHVYSAVPISCVPDGDEILDWCDKLVETCTRTGMHYMLGETTFYHPQTMYCRRQAAEGAFGQFVHAEGDYLHDVDSPSCNLRDVARQRADSAAGREWQTLKQAYIDRGVKSGPMHYPTHSTSGPISVMGAHAVKVAAHGYPIPENDQFYANEAFSNETAMFWMSNDSTMLIREHRNIATPNFEGFRLFGTKGSFEDDQWVDKSDKTPVTVDEMRDPLPAEVAAGFASCSNTPDYYGGHGGSHAYLVHEFVDAIANERTPAINVWEAVKYMAAGVMAHKSALSDGETLEVPVWTK